MAINIATSLHYAHMYILNIVKYDRSNAIFVQHHPVCGNSSKANIISKESVTSVVNERCDGVVCMAYHLSTEAPMAHIGKNLHYSSGKILCRDPNYAFKLFSIYKENINLSPWRK